MLNSLANEPAIHFATEQSVINPSFLFVFFGFFFIIVIILNRTKVYVRNKLLCPAYGNFL